MSIEVKFIPTYTKLAFIVGVLHTLSPEEGVSE